MSFGHDIAALVAGFERGLLAKHVSWPRVKLSEVADLLNGFPYESAKFSDADGVPLLRIRDILPGRTETRYNGKLDDPRMFRVRNGDLVVGMDGDFNARIWQGGEALLNQRVCLIRAREEIYSQKFLAYLLPGYLKLINEHTSSVTVKHLSSRTLQDTPFPFPPLAQQRRIVAQIDTLFAETAEGEAALAEARKGLEVFRRALLKAAVTGELTKDWRATNGIGETGSHLLARIRERLPQQVSTRSRGRRSAAPPSLDLESLAPIPEGWAWTRMGSTLTHLTSGSRDWAEYYDRGDSVFIMAQNVRPGRYNHSYTKHVDPPKHLKDVERSRVQRDDLLITIVGANTGDVCRVDFDATNYFVCQSVALMRPALPELAGYLAMYLGAPDGGRREMDKVIYGAGRPHLSFDQIESLPVPLPPSEEINEILRRVSDALAAYEDALAILNAETSDAARLKQSILKAAFEGRLVPQDPADEPASALLARAADYSGAQAKRGRRKAAGANDLAT